MDKDFLFKFATSNNNYSFKKWGQHDKNCERFMTQQEFFNRTNVKVSEDEFWAINAMYNYCEVDKDEFCKMWCKMNKSRVDAAKRKIKAQKKDDKCKAILDKWFDGLKNSLYLEQNYDLLFVYSKIPAGFVEALSRFDLRIESRDSLSDVYFKVGFKFGYING